MKDKRDINYYVFEVGKDGYKYNDNELCWNVFDHDYNTNSIEVFNIFDSIKFRRCVYNAYKKNSNTFEEFAKEIKSSLSYSFWSKCEYETVITSFPPKIDDKEIDRLCGVKDTAIKENKLYVSEYVNLKCGEKIDIYTQVMLNWDIFIKYLWENKNKIKEFKE